VVQFGQLHRLGAEPFALVGPGELAGQHHFQRDLAAERLLAGAVDDAHAAAAEFAEQLVAGNLRERRSRRRRRNRWLPVLQQRHVGVDGRPLVEEDRGRLRRDGRPVGRRRSLRFRPSRFRKRGEPAVEQAAVRREAAGVFFDRRPLTELGAKVEFGRKQLQDGVSVAGQVGKAGQVGLGQDAVPLLPLPPLLIPNQGQLIARRQRVGLGGWRQRPVV
jgi:hypothetical protein